MTGRYGAWAHAPAVAIPQPAGSSWIAPVAAATSTPALAGTPPDAPRYAAYGHADRLSESRMAMPPDHMTPEQMAAYWDDRTKLTRMELDRIADEGRYATGSLDAGDGRMRLPRGVQPGVYLQQKTDSIYSKVGMGQRVAAAGITQYGLQESLRLPTDEFIAAANQTLLDGFAGMDQVLEVGDTDPRVGRPGSGAPMLASEHQMSKFVSELQGTLGSTRAKIASTYDRMQSLGDRALQTTDPAELAALQDEMNQLEAELEALLKEQEKQEAILALLIAAMAGYVSGAALQKLRDMGLGHVADQVVKMVAKYWRSQPGGMPPQLAAELAAWGYADMVRPELEAAHRAIVDQHEGRIGQARNATERNEKQQTWDQQRRGLQAVDPRWPFASVAQTDKSKLPGEREAAAIGAGTGTGAVATGNAGVALRGGGAPSAPG